MLFFSAFVALAVSASSVAATPIEARKTEFIFPTADPFYVAPANLSAYAYGEVIRERSMHTDVTGHRSSIQILYKTKDGVGRDDATVTTVFAPLKVAPGVPKILSIQFAQDSAAFDCAPSFNILKNTPSNGLGLTSGFVVSTANAALHRGYYVSIPDHEGSRSGFIVGRTSGRATLDGVRAIINHKTTLPDATDNKIILHGYSGGAHATSWAAQIAAEYAPELNIVAISSGGLPTNPSVLLQTLSGGLFAGLAGAALVGFMQTYDDLNAYVRSIMKPEAQQDLDFLSKKACLPQAIIGLPFKDIFRLGTRPRKEILANPAIKGRLEENIIGAPGAPIPAFPQYIYSGITDEVIANKAVTEYVEDQCARGARIEYHRDLVSEHLLEQVLHFLPAFGWIAEAFEGVHDNVVGCSRKDHLLSLLGPLSKKEAADAEKLIGPDALAGLQTARQSKSETQVDDE